MAQGGPAQSGLAVQSSIGAALDEAPTGRFHRRVVLVSGAGFFTDAYDLFVISTVALLATTQWHLSTTETSWVTGAAILGAFVGAFVFGRIADVLGRKRVYVLVAVIMIIGALASALSPNWIFLVVARFVLGLGIGGDYPVSAVLMSEYSNRKDRGRLVGMVFSMQAVGLIVGPLVALLLIGSGVGNQLTWRLLLGLGAIPAAAVVYMRTLIPESPRFRSHVEGATEAAASELGSFTGIEVAEVEGSDPRRPLMTIRKFFQDRRMLVLVLGTAGTWLLFDYAYYGNTLSLPAILKEVSPHASLTVKLIWTLALFVVFALPGYLLAFLKMDRIGHKRLQLIGFSVMTLAFATLGAFERLTTMVVPFLLVFGLSYFFVQFGPNMTTFVLPSEVFPVNMRTTGHGIAAGMGKFGAFLGVFLVPALQETIGLRGMLLVAAGAAVGGFLLTLPLPEPSQRSLEELADPGSDALSTVAQLAPIEMPLAAEPLAAEPLAAAGPLAVAEPR
ncbi:MAG: MFS transporter [Acidimicrobiales bacterium]